MTLSSKYKIKIIGKSHLWLSKVQQKQFDKDLRFWKGDKEIEALYTTNHYMSKE